MKNMNLRYLIVTLLMSAAVLSAGCGNTNAKESPEVQTEESQEIEKAKAEEVSPTETPATETPAAETQAADASASEEKGQEAAQPENIQTQNGQTDAGLEEAKAAALKDAGLTQEKVTFTKEKKDYDDGREEYEIEFVTEDTKYEYEVAAEDGRILKAGQEPIVQIPQNLKTQGVLSVEEARKAAAEAAGLDEAQAAYTKVELDYDDGMSTYEIEFFADGVEYSCELDASTGKVLEMEQDMANR